jgi:hypothetical protein
MVSFSSSLREEVRRRDAQALFELLKSLTLTLSLRERESIIYLNTS